ncbi:MAG: cytochrome c biogenesis protein [Candidatus Thorarchaeota archaeon]
MSNRRLIFFGFTAALSLLYVYMTWIYAPPEQEQGELIRIFFQHIAPALVGYGAFGVTLVCSGLYLWKGEMKYDVLGAASVKVGLFYTTITLISGSIWAGAAWNSPWNWDPRETTTLILWIAYACVLVYRASVTDRESRAQYGSIFGIVAFPMVILSYLSIRIWQTLHPLIIEERGIHMGLEHGITLMVSMIAVALMASILLELTYRVDTAHEKLMRIRMSRS